MVAVKVGARIIVKHVVKKAAKKYVKKTVKKSVKKYVKKTVKKTAKKTYKKPKKSKITKKKNNKTNKKSRAKSSNKKRNVSKPKKQPQKKVQKRTSGGCFVAGTMISTGDGFIPIEEIKVGDRVWSEDTATGEKALKKVKKVFVREKDSIIRLSINGEFINTTEEHPFWIKDQGWIPAGSINAGDMVKLQSGDYVPIEEYQVIILDEPVPVYNFHVEDYECYYVSEQNVLVHNNACAPQTTKPVNLPSYKKINIDMQHILSGHVKGGSRVSKSSNKSLFPDSYSPLQIKRVIVNAYKNGKRIKTQGKNVLVRGKAGNLNIEMYVNTSTKTIETAYPIIL